MVLRVLGTLHSFSLNGECLSSVAYGKIGNEPRLVGYGAEDFRLKWFYHFPVGCGQVRCPYRRGVGDDRANVRFISEGFWLRGDWNT